MKTHDRRGDDLMISGDLLDNLKGGAYPLVVRFHVYRLRFFRPDIRDFGA
jgi:hypothetical protein